MTPNRILSVKQPYAELIASGEKQIENRTWNPSYRGIVWIHAGKSPQYFDDKERQAFEVRRGARNGGIVAACRLVEIIPGDEPKRLHEYLTANPEQQKHAEGPFCWILENAVRVPFYPLKGRLGLWSDPDAWSFLSKKLPGDWLK